MAIKTARSNEGSAPRTKNEKKNIRGSEMVFDHPFELLCLIVSRCEMRCFSPPSVAAVVYFLRQFTIKGGGGYRKISKATARQ